MKNRPMLSLIFLLLTWLMTSAAGEILADPQTRAPQVGDVCIACGASHDHIEAVKMHKGRWVPVCEKCDGTAVTSANLDSFFMDLQPRGALFQESSISEREMNPGWFLFGVWVAIALLAAAFSGAVAIRKGLPPVKWFFTGLIGSVFGAIYTLMQPAKETIEIPENLGKIPTTAAPIPCPDCQQLNHPSASACAHCGNALNPAVVSEAAKVANN